jgi:long-subunit acyl-CoA synthetase (AMP-forming)
LALYLQNTPGFVIALLAGWKAGAVPVPVNPMNRQRELSMLLADCTPAAMVCQDTLFHEVAADLAARPPLIVTTSARDFQARNDQRLFTDDAAAASSTPGLAAIVASGRDAGASPALPTAPEDIAFIVYTSGTTGAPKGVELTHRNVVALCAALVEALGLEPGQRAISWLPMAHIAERLCTHYIPMHLGWAVTCLANPRGIGALLTDVRPEFFFSPPRLWEKLRAGTIAKLGEHQDAATALAALGLDDVRVAITGAAPCPAEVIEFWHGLGLPLYEVYGMSETTGVATVNAPGAVRIGTVGRPLPGVDVTLSDAGEVLMRGPVVMRGYRNRPEATAEALDAEGWMHSGDVGVVDADGYLRIVDRIKELIISAAGKNMSPANIEGTIKSAGSAIGSVCAIGDARPYNVALVTIDPEAAATLSDPQAEVAAQIERANEKLARVEQIKRFALLAVDWAPGGDELTPTMKLKRKPIAAKYAAEIESLYA